ncbi:MAG: class D sortase [Candidatus Acidiferrales bacterium]
MQAAHSATRASSILRNFSTVLLLAGGLLLGGYAFLMVHAHAFQLREIRRLHSLLAGASPDARAGRSYEFSVPESHLEMGALFGELEIPRIGIDTIVLQGDDSSILRSGAGHIPYTAMPDDPGGNVAIAAHRDMYFRPLRFIQPNDLILIKTPAGIHQYRVQFTRIVPPSDVSVLDADATGQRTLTLVTCYPFYFVGSAPNRLIVRATAAD